MSLLLGKSKSSFNVDSEESSKSQELAESDLCGKSSSSCCCSPSSSQGGGGGRGGGGGDNMLLLQSCSSVRLLLPAAEGTAAAVVVTETEARDIGLLHPFLSLVLLKLRKDSPISEFHIRKM